MSTQQQALVMDTVVAIRRTLKRKSYDSDSDSSVQHNTNRGNKLKRKSRFVQQGRMAPSIGSAAYKEVAEHAGYQRALISMNPPLIDEEGYDIESDDDEEQIQEAMASAMESSPYTGIRLEQLLAPLTAVTDLPTHPTLSRPFTSPVLTELVQQGCYLMHKENATLAKARPLLTKLIGDNIWAPCGLMTGPDDEDALLFNDTASFFKPGNRPWLSTTAPTLPINGDTNAENPTSETKASSDGPPSEGKHKGSDNTLPDGDAAKANSKPNAGGETLVNGNSSQAGDGSNNADKVDDVEMTDALASTATAEPPRLIEPHAPPPPNHNSSSLAPGASPAPSSHSDLFIHPIFHLPAAAHPDRDLMLPEQEADDVRRLLQLYIQKQEEVCRGTEKLYKGLLKADRLRKMVLQWAKAEAHCGPNRDMSDGEDWYDKEEWGLTEDLKKGEDEVEEDTAATTQKKTRNRRT